ncbi:MAG: VTT domain-containing protein [Clostridia bacterium]|nr:VTT domain-containing protein [Clostridia bacterium]
MEKSRMTLKDKLSLAGRILFSIVLVSLIIWKFDALKNIDVAALIDGVALPKALATILGVYAVKGAAFVVPASLVYIAVGMSIPIMWALAVNTVGIVIEITISYLIGVILGGNFVTKKLKATKNGQKIFKIYEEHSKSSVLIMRFAGLPIDFCSLFFGAMRVNYFSYVLMSLAGILPRVILFTILGEKVYGLIPMEYVIPVAAVALVIVVIVSTIKFAVKSAKGKVTSTIEADEETDTSEQE